jgi:oligopeptide transport system substrate-binding protein
VEVLDSRTLRVTLGHPVVFFPDLCAFPVYFPQHRRSMQPFAEPPDPMTGRISYRPGFTRPPHLVSNGPYRLAEWEFKRVARLEASDYYWNRKAVRSRVIDQVYASDSQWAFLQYDSGQAQWLGNIDRDLAAELWKQGRKDLHVFPGFGTEIYSINCRPKLPDGRDNPFVDARVRRAFSLAIRKEPIVQNITRLGQPVARSFVPVGIFPGYPSPEGLGFDPAQAKRLLIDAGYGPGRPFPRFALIYNKESSIHEQTAQYVRWQWLENLGVTADLEAMEVKIYRKRLHERMYTIARASWIGDYNDVSTFTDKYLSFSDNNDAGWENAEYDRLCARAAREIDAERRLKLLSQAEEVLCHDAPIIPLYHYVNTYLFREDVRGLPLDAGMNVMMSSLWCVSSPSD